MIQIQGRKFFKAERLITTRQIMVLLAMHGLMFTVACASASGTSARSDITAPATIRRVEPVVPAELRHIRGVVEVAGTIPKEGGRMRDLRIVHSEDSRLNQFVLDALATWTWKPGTLKGEPVDSEFSGKFSFPQR